MGSFESLWYFKGRLEAGFWNFVLVAVKMAPKVGTVASKIDFSRFPGKRDIESGILSGRHKPSTRRLHLPSFILIRSAVWPAGSAQTHKQTSQVAPRTSASSTESGSHGPKRPEICFAWLCRCESIGSHVSARNQTFRWHKVNGQQSGAHRIWGLPEGNFEEISKTSENICNTEFPALRNGTNGVLLRLIATELERPWKICVAEKTWK